MGKKLRPPKGHISSRQIEKLWGMTRRQLQHHQTNGLPFTKQGRTNYFQTSVCEAWIRANRKPSTWPPCFHEDVPVPQADERTIDEILAEMPEPEAPDGPVRTGPKPLPDAARERLEQQRGQFVLPPNPTKEEAQIFASVTRARLVELKIAEIESRLVDRQEALDLISGMVKNLRKLLMAVPEQVAHEVASLSDPRETRRVIDGAIRGCLNTLVENPELLAAPSNIEIEEEV